jgi:hypothetical protein
VTVSTHIDPAITEMRESMDRLRGRLYEAIEAVGFPSRQEAAIIRLTRRITYDAQADLESLLRGRT